MTGARRPTRKRDGAAPPLHIDILIQAGDWPARRRLRRLTARALGVAVDLSGILFAPDDEVSVVFTDDSHIRDLNRAFRDKDKPTNVLSFPAAPSTGKNRFGPILGDLVLAEETIQREAADQGLRFDDHVTHLIIHGFLHLIGHDHETEGEATVMERLETAILGRLGIADPYAVGDSRRAD
jgi:probable rRNA maturation factor